MVTNETWPGESRALCAQTAFDPNIFFPPTGNTSHLAKLTCGLCDVRDNCLQYALENPELEGIWGGLGDKRRIRLRMELGIEHSNKCRCNQCYERQEAS